MVEQAVLHYGMGCDSSSWLVDYLTNPKSQFKQFELSTILFSQTGNESAVIKKQVEAFILPLLTKYQIRTVQIARKSSSLADGYVVLEDTRNPYICYTRPTAEKPYFTLEDEMLLAATVPQYASGRRRCSQKFKAKILDLWHDRNCLGCYKIIGFDALEGSRISRYDNNQQSLHPAVFPLYEQGWEREFIKNYLKEFAGEEFYRSACYFCPFSQTAGSVEEIKAKYELHPYEAAKAAYLEYVSLCFNPRQSLSSSGKSIVERGLLNEEARQMFQLELSEATWKIYRVKRIRGLNVPYRSVEAVAAGSRQAMLEKLQQIASQQGFSLKYCQHKILRCHIPVEGENCEEFLVAAPGNPMNKERNAFSNIWSARNSLFGKQLSLL